MRFSLTSGGTKNAGQVRQTAWLIDQAFPDTDTSDFAGSVRCSAPGGDLFTAVALEMDPGTRIFTTLPVVPVPERTDRE